MLLGKVLGREEYVGFGSGSCYRGAVFGSM